MVTKIFTKEKNAHVLLVLPLDQYGCSVWISVFAFIENFQSGKMMGICKINCRKSCYYKRDAALDVEWLSSVW